MDFDKKDSYSIEDIKSLITNEVEENVHLDYKAAGALAKEDKKRMEITKDVSAFANSDGGIIIYGVLEKDHRPDKITPVDGRTYTKEWLENVIQLIQPRIEGITIYPIRIDNLENSVYIVKIPRSDNAPHMAKDKKYYKRFNFKSEPMEDYEIKDLYNRVYTPNLKIEDCTFVCVSESQTMCEYELIAKITNEGKCACDTYKLNFYINKLNFHEIKQGFKDSHFSYTAIDKNRLKLSINSRETIYPNEMLDVGHIRILVKKENDRVFWNRLIIDMILFYLGGQDEMAYIPSTNEFIKGRDEINRLLERE